MKYLIYLLLFYCSFFDNLRAQNAHKGTPGTIVHCDFRTTYQVRIDTGQKVIQVGNYSELVEYKVFEDTVLYEFHFKKELFPLKVPKIFSMLSVKKSIPKKYKKLQKELSVHFGNKVFLIKELEENILFVCTRCPQRQSPFKRISFCHLININAYNKEDTIYTNNFLAKTDLEFFFDKFLKKYILVRKIKSKKKYTIANDLITIPSS